MLNNYGIISANSKKKFLVCYTIYLYLERRIRLFSLKIYNIYHYGYNHKTNSTNFI